MERGAPHDHHVPGVAGLIGMAVSGTTAVGLEFIAYRPLRNVMPNRSRSSSPRSVCRSSAGVRPLRPAEGADGPAPGWVESAAAAIKLVEPTEQFSFFGASVTNVILIIVFSAVGLAVGVDFPDQQDQAGTRNSFGGTRS